MPIYERCYTEVNGRHSTIYPGRHGRARCAARGAVSARLRDQQVGTLHAARCSNTSGSRRYFTQVVAGDTLPQKKPDPAPLLHACRGFGVAPREMLLIGDSLNDAQAARAAGCPVFCVPYGYNEGQDVRELDVDAIVRFPRRSRRETDRKSLTQAQSVHRTDYGKNGPAIAARRWRRWRRSSRRLARALVAPPRSFPFFRQLEQTMTEVEFERARARGLQPRPGGARDLRRSRHAALDLPQAREPPLHLPARIGRRRRAFRPLLVHRARGANPARGARRTTCAEMRGGRAVERSDEPPTRSRSSTPILQRFRVAQDAKLPRFCGGLVGYFGYDTVRYIERRLAGVAQARRARRARHPAPRLRRDRDRRQPVGQAHAGRVRRARRARRVPARRARGLTELLARLREPVAMPADVSVASEPAVSGFGEAAYHAAVERAKRYVYDGDIMQVVPSQRMSKPFRASPLALYRALRTHQSVALHVLFRLRRFPRRRRLARDPRAAGRRHRDGAPDRRHAPARRDAGRGRGARRGAARGRRRSAPSTSCSWTSAATTSAASR